MIIESINKIKDSKKRPDEEEIFKSLKKQAAISGDFSEQEIVANLKRMAQTGLVTRKVNEAGKVSYKVTGLNDDDNADKQNSVATDCLHTSENSTKTTISIQISRS